MKGLTLPQLMSIALCPATSPTHVAEAEVELATLLDVPSITRRTLETLRLSLASAEQGGFDRARAAPVHSPPECPQCGYATHPNHLRGLQHLRPRG